MRGGQGAAESTPVGERTRTNSETNHDFLMWAQAAKPYSEVSVARERTPASQQSHVGA